jgi:flagellar biosynthesis/type III secretory pathway protein FliH
MARIYKAFQVKIDKDHKVAIPTANQPAAPPAETEEDIEGLFRELSPDRLAGTGAKGTVDPEARAPAGPEKTAPGAPPGGPAASPPTGGAAPAPAAGPGVGPGAGPSPGSGPGAARPGGGQAGPLPPGAIEAVLSAPATAARDGSAMSAVKRKALELMALEQRLREWEQSLVERESALLKEEEKFHHEMMARRQTVEEETKKQLEMARKSAETIMATARAEAETLRKGLAVELEAIKQKAYKEGFALGEEKGIAAGEKAGLEEIRLDWQNLMQETELLISELQTSRMGLLKAAEEEMVKLVIAFAKRVLKTEPLVRPEIILQNIDAALNKISEVDKIVIRINLKDKSMTEAHKQEFLRRLHAVADVKVVEDPSLPQAHQEGAPLGVF